MAMPMQEIIRLRKELEKHIEQRRIWEQPLQVPADSWLWHEVTSLHGTADPAYQVWLKLSENKVLMSLRGAVDKRARLVVLPWDE